MTQGEFQKLLTTMKSLYSQPTFIPDENAMELWFDLLKDLDYEQANKALMNHMATSKFPPMPADIREKAAEYVTSDYMTPLEAWGLAYKAVGNSIYNSKEEFEKLPPIIQKVVGNHETLREWAMMDINDVQTVEQSHFIRSYREECEKDKKVQAMPENLRRLAAETAGRLSGE